MRFLCALLVMAIAPAVHAVKVHNQDEQPHTLVVTYPNVRKEITLGPDEFYHTRNPSATLQLGEQFISMTFYESEYSIRKGRLILMRRDLGND